MSTASADALREADELVDTLAELGKGDYSALREHIALEVYDEGFWNGNWDVNFDPNDYGFIFLPAFRMIQEDEFDQHTEDADSMDAYYAGGGYLVFR